MSNYKTIICLVSEQAVPNYLPLINIESIEKVVLIASNRMNKKAIDFVETLKKYNEHLNVTLINIAHENSIQSLNDEFEQKLQPLLGDNLLANVTGGTKIMSITLTNWANQHGIDICYVDKNDLQIYNAQNNTEKQIKLNTQLFLGEYLSMYGSYNTINNLGRNGEPLAADISTREIDFVNRLTDNYNPYLLKQLHKEYQDKVDLKKSNQYQILLEQFGFSETEAKNLIIGRWLEIFVYQTLLEKLGSDYVGFGYRLANRHQFPEGTILDTQKHVTKDYDVIFLYHNTLHIIECKTSYKPEPLDAQTHVPNHLFKLNTLTNIKDFGLYARKFYVTNYTINENLQTQAKVYDITHIQAMAKPQDSLHNKKEQLLQALGIK